MFGTDLYELKSFLDIDPDNTSEDKFLNFLVEQATAWVEEYLNRKLAYGTWTEFYDGTGTEKLLLKRRPVYNASTIQVWADDTNDSYYGSESGSFDSSTQLTYGVDFCLRLDNSLPDGTPFSRSGILIRIRNIWSRPNTRADGWLSPYMGQDYGNIKVVYTAGFTTNTMPADIRYAINQLVAAMRYLFPLGMPLSSESYEERSITVLGDRKDYLMGIVKPILANHRNWKW